MRISFQKAVAPVVVTCLTLATSALLLSNRPEPGPIEDLAAQGCSCLSGTTPKSSDLAEKLVTCVYLPFQQNYESLSAAVTVPAGADGAVYLNEKYEEALEAQCPGYRELALKAALLD